MHRAHGRYGQTLPLASDTYGPIFLDCRSFSAATHRVLASSSNMPASKATNLWRATYSSRRSSGFDPTQLAPRMVHRLHRQISDPVVWPFPFCSGRTIQVRLCLGQQSGFLVQRSTRQTHLRLSRLTSSSRRWTAPFVLCIGCAAARAQHSIGFADLTALIPSGSLAVSAPGGKHLSVLLQAHEVIDPWIANQVSSRGASTNPSKTQCVDKN
jgi:hypothetical protein